MSCFVVPDFHIDTLVSWAVAHKAPAFFTGVDPRELARMLHAANVVAVNYRYGHGETPEYVFSFRDARNVSPVQILKACDCFEYQCDGDPTWANSHAARALEAIRGTATRALPGYDEAAWTLDQGVTA